MPPRTKTLKQGGWRAFALSLLVHGLIVAVAVFGWFKWKHEPSPMEVLPVEGMLVDSSVLKGAVAPPKPEPPPPEVLPAPEPEPAPVEEQGPPKPDPAELERKKEEERVAKEKIEQEKLEQQKAVKDREEADQRDAEKKAVAKAVADKAAAEKALADKKALEKKRADDAIAAKKAADEKVRLAREAELRRSIEAEERGNAARNSDDAARWHAAIVARITRAWIRPPSARPGIECSVTVSQTPDGQVTAVHVDSCTGGDAALHDSVEAAVLRASPLPTPPAGVPFERTLELTFAPSE
jgi:colicin import membrane protein